MDRRYYTVKRIDYAAIKQLPVYEDRVTDIINAYRDLFSLGSAVKAEAYVNPERWSELPFSLCAILVCDAVHYPNIESASGYGWTGTDAVFAPASSQNSKIVQVGFVSNGPESKGDFKDYERELRKYLSFSASGGF